MKLTKLIVFCFLSILFSVYGQAQDVTVKGRVNDEKGLPIPGATILTKGTSKASTSDFDGNYEIKAPANGTLVISFIGYTTMQELIKGRTQIDVRLKPESQDLKEVVVIGYGSQRKQDITSAITTVKLGDISSRPIISAADAITGKSPGVQVSSPSGSPGGELSVRVRGIGSPNGGEPLYVVNGVITNNIKAIDPSNIESISILKDASAAGIYGAAGSTNGVVIITTKKGTKGKPLTELKMYTGVQQISKKLDVLNNAQYLDLQEEISGVPIVLPNYYDINTKNNWQDLIYRDALQNNINLNTSGGTENGTYYLGLGHLSQEGVIKGSDYKRYSVNLSIDQNVTKYLKLGTSINYNRSYQRSITDNATANFGGVVTSALSMPQYIPVFFGADSPYPGLYGRSSFMSGENALANIKNNDNLTITNNILGNAYAEISLPFDIKFKSQFNATTNNSRWDYFQDPFATLTAASTGGTGESSNNEVFRWGIDNTLSWKKVFGNHTLDATVGTAELKERILNSFQHGEGFGSNAVHTLNAASKNYSIGTSMYEWSTQSYFGRLNYAYDNRYLATVTFRRDGSSRVGENNRWGDFPAFSVGWKISNEKFMENINWVQDLRFRAGWGKTGNLPPYTLLYPSSSLLNAGATYPYSGGTSTPGVNPGSLLGNPDLKWESASQSNIGFDASFLNKKLTLTVDYYYKKVNDLIFTQQLPLTTGGVFQALNLPGNNINKGLEFSLDADIIKTGDFEWNSNFNISLNNNVMKGLNPDISFQTGGVTVGGSRAEIPTQTIRNGLPLGTFWGYKTYGVDPQTGNLIYGNEPEVIGNALPKFTFGFTNNFKYKNFNLSFLIDGTQGNDVYNALRMEIESMNGFQNQSTAVLRRWQQPGDITDVPRALGNRGENSGAAALMVNRASSYFIEDGSFVRLRNVTLGYDFSDSMAKKLGIGGAKIYFTAQNLFTITKYSGYNPEVNAYGQGTNNQASGSGSGISLLALGIDRGTYPAAKTFTLGLNVKL